MISRKTAMVIADTYVKKFSHNYRNSFGNYEDKVNRDHLYDFLYEHEYEAWFCNMVKKIYDKRVLKDFFLKLHTGETASAATPNWSWEKRKQLGQSYLINLAKDFLLIYNKSDDWSFKIFKDLYEELIHRLEIDGYVLRDGGLRQVEIEVLDVEAETGLLESLYTKLGLDKRTETFEFLKIMEEHYIAGRWADSIGNARKFFELVFQQVASKHSISKKYTSLAESDLQQPVFVRSYLEREMLLERKEREAVDKIYGLLSHTGGHPYMAEEDQARLLRQICLTMTQFIMLRLEGALK